MDDDRNAAMNPRWVFAAIWLVFFLQGMGPGMWMPALTNILGSMGLREWVPWAFIVSPVCALVSPLIGGALADQRVPANRLFVWSTVVAALGLLAAFWVLEAGWHPLWFLGFLGISSLAGGPAWGLLATVSMTHLRHGERAFPLVRVGATIGWIAGGLTTSHLLLSDNSVLCGYASAGVRMAAAFAAMLLPLTLPLGRATSWKSRLGLDAFVLMKQRDHLVFFLVTALYSIPISALYMYAPELLKVLGDPRPTGTMTIAQVLEVVSMFALGAMMTRMRVKALLMWSLGLSVLRFALSATAGWTGMIGWHLGGIALHGMCYTFYFITAQIFLDRRVDPGMKGQAQGLLSMVSSGLGPLMGALVCGWLREHLVADGVHGWDAFWLTLSAMAALCFVVFGLFYRGRAKDPA
ncbi:MAG: MFS transporter [Verrucomicrobia bacterium]|nr:MFS transporter [Verrucomicrobiota bacterium]